MQHSSKTTFRRRAFSRICLALLTTVGLVTAVQQPARADNSSIKNFSRIDYGAASQNWSVSAGTDGMLFFANNSGLLEFDGTNWKLHRLPNETILRSVVAAGNDLVYTGGYQELGFWKRDASGQLIYHSLVPQAHNYIGKNDEFWSIAVVDSTVYFHTFNRVLVYANDSVSAIPLPRFSFSMHHIGNRLLITEANIGLSQIENGRVKPFFTSPVFNGTTIRFVIPYVGNQLLIGTASHGLFVLDNNTLREWNPDWTDYFKKNELNRACLSMNGDLILGTILDGIVVFDKSGQLKTRCNTATGLQNNTVLAITTDQFNNIWLGLDRGIGFISSTPAKGFQLETINNIGAVYTAAVYHGKLYLGTNQGLFERDFPAVQGPFRLVPGSQGQIWDSRVIDDQLFIGHNAGTMLITPTETRFISNHSGGFAIRQDTFNPKLLVQSTYSNLVVYETDGRHYHYRNYIDNFYDLIRYIEIDHHGTIWASHMHRGIFRLRLDDERKKMTEEQYFGERSVFGKDHSIHVFKIENRIVFISNEKLYTYDDLRNKIIVYDELNRSLGKFAAAHRIVEAPGHHYWFIAKAGFALFRIDADQVKLVREYPRSVFTSNQPIDEYENVYPLTETKAIVCLENGIAWLDAAEADQNPTINYFQPQLSELQLINQRNTTATARPKNKYLEVENAFNNLVFKFSFPHFSNQPVYYRAIMEGLGQEWSEKSENSVFRFDRVPAGTYTLKVKAIDSWGYESQVYELTIEILPPWYLSTPGMIGLGFLIVVILLVLRQRGITRIKRKEQLEHDRRERELIRLRNEKLDAEVTYKSKELANSTMSIIKKNEFLMDLQRVMTDQKEQLGSRYPDKYYLHLSRMIDENISSQDDWQVFETNFERAHELFLKKLKVDFPDLTNKDLRLCAYLRMNLSSKEIAPLMGISVRGVENHRYRLRKKMDMEHDDTLINFILKY